MHRIDGRRWYGRHGFQGRTSPLLASGLFLMQRLPRIARRFDLLLSRRSSLLWTTSRGNFETSLRCLRWGTVLTKEPIIGFCLLIDIFSRLDDGRFSSSWRTSARKRKAGPGICVILPALNATEFWAVSVTSCVIHGRIAFTVSTLSFPSIAMPAVNQSESIKVKKQHFFKKNL